MYRLDRMRRDYQRFTKANEYIVGFPIDEDVYGARLDKIPRRYLRVQRETDGTFGLYLCVNTKKFKRQLLKKAEKICSLSDLIDSKYNKGVMFEKKIYEHYGQEFRGKDRVPFHKSGDITIDGKEVQVKYLHARMCYDKTLTRLKKST